MSKLKNKEHKKSESGSKDQIKNLIKSERELYETHNLLEVQLDKINRLSQLNLSITKARSAEEVLAIGIQFLSSNYVVTYAVGLIYSGEQKQLTAVVKAERGLTLERTIKKVSLSKYKKLSFDPGIKIVVVNKKKIANEAAGFAKQCFDAVFKENLQFAPDARVLFISSYFKANDSRKILLLYCPSPAALAYQEQTPKQKDIKFLRLFDEHLNIAIEKLIYKQKRQEYAVDLEQAVAAKTASLKERVKELTNLYKISDIIVKFPPLNIKALINKIANVIPSACRFPKSVCAQICIGVEKGKTSNFKRTSLRQVRQILLKGESAGYVEVCYLKKANKVGVVSFAKEEEDFFDELVRMLSADIEKREIEKQLIHLNTILRAIRVVDQVIVKEKDKNKLLKVVCKRLVKAKGYAAVWIALFDKEEKLELVAEAGLDKKFNFAADLFKKGGKTCIKKALKCNSGAIKTKLSVCNNYLTSSHEHPEGSYALGIQLKHGRKVYGVLTVYLYQPFIKNKGEEELIKEIAGDLAFALHKIELEQEKSIVKEKLKESEEKFRLIYETSSDAFMTLEPPLWRFTSSNRAAIKLFGAKNKKEFCSLEPWQLSPKRQPDGQLSDLKSEKMIDFAVKNGKNFFEWTHKKRNGEIFLATVLLSRIKFKGKVILQARVSDITERKEAETRLLINEQKLERSLLQLIEVSTQIIEKRDPYTAGHQKRVATLARAIAKEMQLTDMQSKTLYLAGLIHDIGKVAIPSEILSHPGVLNKYEIALIRKHPHVGYDITKYVDFPWPLAKLILQHHERLDGTGYPEGLKSKQIDVLSRILAVADVVEAMLSHRPYRPSLGIDAALKEIRTQKNKLYDPDVVDACIKLFVKKGFDLDKEVSRE